MISDMGKKIEIENVASCVCDYYGISLTQLIEQRRTQDIIQAREILAKLCNVFCGAGCAKIGRFLNRHHTTVINSLKKYGDDYKYDAEFRKKADDIGQEIVRRYAAQEHISP